MADELHASLTPNAVNVGGTLEVEIDSSAEEWQNADLAILRIFEVDDASPFEPKPGKDQVVVTCEGTITDNVFSVTPSASNPSISTKAAPGMPIVKIKIGGTVVDVPLPNKDQEQGVFEPKAKKFTSKAPAMVRCFDHFTVVGVPRPVIAFITGARDDDYINTATAFWKLNADVVISKRGISLEEILDMLDKEHLKFGSWGQINIIAHGSPHTISIKLFKDSKDVLHDDQMRKDIDAHTNALTRPGGIDSDIADLRAVWSSKYEFHTKSDTWYTTDDRWEISIKHKGKNKTATASYVFEVSSGKSKIKYKHLSGGGVTFGAVKGKEGEGDVWVVEAEDVADFHFSVDLGPKPGQATVVDEDSGRPTFVGSTKITKDSPLKVTLPVTIKFGKAEVKVRYAEWPIDIAFECKRYHVDRRRTLRLYEPKVAYEKRQLVAPKVSGPTHYGSS